MSGSQFESDLLNFDQPLFPDTSMPATSQFADQDIGFGAGNTSPDDRSWGQQFGDWLGRDSTAKELAALKGGLGDIKKQLADPAAAAAATGQQKVPQIPMLPVQQQAAPSLQAIMQQLLQRRQALGQLGLSGKAYAPRGPGGLLGM
jgi:hypothetical protein